MWPLGTQRGVVTVPGIYHRVVAVDAEQLAVDVAK